MCVCVCFKQEQDGQAWTDDEKKCVCVSCSICRSYESYVQAAEKKQKEKRRKVSNVHQLQSHLFPLSLSLFISSIKNIFANDFVNGLKSNFSFSFTEAALAALSAGQPSDDSRFVDQQQLTHSSIHSRRFKSPSPPEPSLERDSARQHRSGRTNPVSKTAEVGEMKKENGC